MKVPEAKVELRTTIFPTEDQSKLEAAFLALFPDIELKREGDELVGNGKSLQTFIELLTKQRIRDTARDVFLKNREGNVCAFHLNKQVATVAKVGFAEEGESSLGNIVVKMELTDWDGLIALLTPVLRTS